MPDDRTVGVWRRRHWGHRFDDGLGSSPCIGERNDQTLGFDLRVNHGAAVWIDHDCSDENAADYNYAADHAYTYSTDRRGAVRSERAPRGRWGTLGQRKLASMAQGACALAVVPDSGHRHDVSCSESVGSGFAIGPN
jgi:hypothetical protein